MLLPTFAGQEKTAAALNSVLWTPRVSSGGVAQEGELPTPVCLSYETSPSDKPLGFQGRGAKWVQVLTDGCKIPFRTSRAVVPGLCSPEMHRRRVPDTLPHYTSSFTQASPVSLPGHRKRDLSIVFFSLDSVCVHRLYTFQEVDRPYSLCERAPLSLDVFVRFQGRIPAGSVSP